jgi:hypothetical protein
VTAEIKALENTIVTAEIKDFRHSKAYDCDALVLLVLTNPHTATIQASGCAGLKLPGKKQHA